LEYGIDHPGEMSFLISIAKPHITIHTQIDAVHSLQFGSPEEIAAEEFLLLENTRDVVIVNRDDGYLESHPPHIVCDCISYSATRQNTNTTISRESLPALTTSDTHDI
jgi:UDP-N-acetylmuramyl pentapeptide synthase